MGARADHSYFDQILDHLQQTRGFDFSAYKRMTLIRRIRRRMQIINVPTFEEYLDYLQVHQEEFAVLFNTILINVTSFFRDPEVWVYLSKEVLPQLVGAAASNGSIRVWSAGCASGAEPYSIAMLLAELLGLDAFRERVKIYATDVDEEALAEARLASYHGRQVDGVRPELAEKYFDRKGPHYVVHRDVRRAVVFGRHDLIQDAPISRVDLLLCRNTLMYFHAEAQTRVLARLYFSIRPAGLILLGRAEMLFSQSAMFAPVDLKRRLFRTVAKPSQRDRLVLLTQTGRDVMASQSSSYSRLREAAFDSDVVPQIVLDAFGMIAAANAPARQRLGLTSRDIGRPMQDLEVSNRPTELRSAIEQAADTQTDVTVKEVKSSLGGKPSVFEVAVSGLFDEDRAFLGTRISFHDVTELTSLQVELQNSKQELETAYEELQSTNEELETTNEELQSTVEELETTNEELQSTNEELETMNEELQSTNEELQTMNDELRSQGTELNSANAFLESLFTNLRTAVVVLDHEYRVLVWNRRAEELWGLRSGEARNSQFLGLDIGLPVGELRQPVRDVLSGAIPHIQVTLPAANRRGKPIRCLVSVAPVREDNQKIRGAILLMDDTAGELSQEQAR